MKKRWLIPVTALLFAALACNTSGGPATDEARIATAVAATLAVQAPAPTLAPLPSATLELPTAPEPSPTLVPTVAVPGGEGAPAPEAITLLAPGPQSSITSPVHISGEADSTFEQNLVVQITGADGRLLAANPTTIAAELGQRGPFALDLAFSVAADEPGRISVFSTSPRDGGLIHLASVEVTLLAGGTAVINPAAPGAETLALSAPAPLAEVSGGVIRLAGYSEYVFENQLGVVLCGEGGSGAPNFLCGTEDNVLATGAAYVHSPDVGQPGPLDGELNYSVTGSVRARLVMYDASPRDGGYIHAASVEVTLRP